MAIIKLSAVAKIVTSPTDDVGTVSENHYYKIVAPKKTNLPIDVIIILFLSFIIKF